MVDTRTYEQRIQDRNELGEQFKSDDYTASPAFAGAMRKLHKKTTDLEGRINAVSGNFLKSHSHSQASLVLEAEGLEAHANTIHSIISGWTGGTQSQTQLVRDLNGAQTRIDGIRSQIEKRQETFWEQIKIPLARIVRKIASTFDLIPTSLIEGVGTGLKLLEFKDK